MNEHDQHRGAGTSPMPPGGSPSTPASGGTRDELKGRARESAEDVKGAAQQRVNSLFDNQKSAAAEQTHKVSQALHRMGDEFDQQQQTTFSRWANQLADQTDRVADQLRHQDLQRLMRSAGAYSRREPMLFMGGAIAAGFVVSRFLRSSSRHRHDATPAASSSRGAYQDTSPDAPGRTPGGVTHPGSQTPGL
ncbi:hypothetical protein [Halomonas korlensis]|uniref:Membrane-anchored ribosome-binding protein, inhibits growth in stationary phase, ElaB/YqjD/DUF883 family n=1 Tax=Halomonas korlensis TaxID=463301 RepID=A0A1I7K891_9GAMM|nr:hypothetical protein [Halomonas korlensis]SFU93637.1 hypothetical protein SAMN04487955_11577 [Halomonas korlensis]